MKGEQPEAPGALFVHPLAAVVVHKVLKQDL